MFIQIALRDVVAFRTTIDVIFDAISILFWIATVTRAIAIHVARTRDVRRTWTEVESVYNAVPVLIIACITTLLGVTNKSGLCRIVDPRAIIDGVFDPVSIKIVVATVTQEIAIQVVLCRVGDRRAIIHIVVKAVIIIIVVATVTYAIAI